MKSKLLRSLIILLIPLVLAIGWDEVSLAADAVDPPYRQMEIIIPYAESEWWLMRWANNSHECRIIID
ncbi:MAG: hypothetical protein MUO62_13495, partial [Anaerolineales bacterium]|nr:hypothetical protein [Anaerolineales bacterium]